MWWHTSCFNSLKALSGWWYHAPLEMTALIRWNDPRSDFFFNDPGKLGMLMEKKKISRPGFFFFFDLMAMTGCPALALQRARRQT